MNKVHWQEGVEVWNGQVPSLCDTLVPCILYPISFLVPSGFQDMNCDGQGLGTSLSLKADAPIMMNTLF